MEIKIVMIRHNADTTFKWHNMTVNRGNYYGCLKTAAKTIPVFWSGWTIDGDIRLYNAITCRAGWANNIPEVVVLGGEPNWEAYQEHKDRYYQNLNNWQNCDFANYQEDLDYPELDYYGVPFWHR